MSSQDINKAYVSPYDKFFYRFDEEHKKSSSQLAEIKKHARIVKLRDHANQDSVPDEIWEEF